MVGSSLFLISKLPRNSKYYFYFSVQEKIMSLLDLISSIPEVDDIPADPLLSASAEDIDCLVLQLKDEADRHWNIDPNQSVKLAQKIQQIGNIVGDPGTIALGTMALGDAKKLLGQIQEAWNLLGEAGQLYKKANDDVGWARTRIGRLFISPEVDCVDEAVADAATAREILIQANQHVRCVYLDMNMGTVYHRLGDTTQSLQQFHNAFKRTEQLGADGERFLWPIHYNIALAYVEIGKLHEAATNFDNAIDIAVAREETRNAIHAVNGRSYLALLQGKYREALLFINQADNLSQNEFSFDGLFVRRIMVECYLHLNRNLEARNVAQEVVIGLENQHMPHEAARTRVHLATAEAKLGNYEAALKEMDKAKGILNRTRNSIWVARQQIQHAKVLLKLGNTEAAHQLIQQALETFEPGCLNFVAAALLKGEVFLAEGRLEAAHRMVEKSMATAKKLNDLTFRYSAYVLLGRIAEARERPKRAARYYRAGVATLERSYRHLTITLRSGFLEDKGEALRALIRLQLSMGNTIDAFKLLERAKSLTLLGYLSNRDSLKWKSSDQETEQLLGELRRLREEHSFFYHRVFYDLDTGNQDKSAVNYERDVEELQTRENRIRKITDQLYLLNEHTTLIKDATLPSLDEIQDSLSDDDLLIEYFNDGIHIWVFVLDSAGIEVLPIPHTLGVVDELINKLQANLDWAMGSDPKDPISSKLTTRFQQIAQRLYASLIQPIKHRIESKTRLVIVPYGALHYLPFNTLFNGEQYLIEKHEIIIVPSSSLLPRQAPCQTGGARVLAHSWDGKLQKTHLEAQDVHRLLGDEVFIDDEAVRAVLNEPPLKVLHIAAHGEYRIDVPELSYINLGDGQLFFDDALQSDLSYELVVLSGCETGRANITPGDEVIGLGRGFLYAGAGAIIASLWRIDDTLTRTLMKRFYAHLAEGNSKAGSVRAAQQEMLREDRGLHPAFWGTFQLVGDPDPLSKD
jgi:CHAT domain-containing protein